MKRRVLKVQVSTPPLIDLAIYPSWIKLLCTKRGCYAFTITCTTRASQLRHHIICERTEGRRVTLEQVGIQRTLSRRGRMVIEGRPVLCASSIVKLYPKLVNGVLTVPRRNNKAEQPWKAKHLITLYHQHDVIRPTVISCHRKLIHVGVEHNTMCLLTSPHWGFS